MGAEEVVVDPPEAFGGPEGGDAFDGVFVGLVGCVCECVSVGRGVLYLWVYIRQQLLHLGNVGKTRIKEGVVCMCTCRSLLVCLSTYASNHQPLTHIYIHTLTSVDPVLCLLM